MASAIAVLGADPQSAEVDVRPQPGDVRQQVADGDVAPCRIARSRGCRRDTRSLSRILPCSTSIITLVVVATTLVSDARSKMVSSVIGSGGRHERAIADGLLIQDAIAAADEDDRAPWT